MITTLAPQLAPRLEPAERCAEYLRLAVQSMTRHPARPDPYAYAVWYTHVSGRHAALSQELTARVASGAAIDDAQIRQLFERHLLGDDQRTARDVAGGLRQMLDRVGASAAATAQGAERFGVALARWRDAVDNGEAVDPARCAEMQQDTHAVRSAVDGLRDQLDRARSEAESLRHELDRVRDEALIDVLTGLPNRRCFEARLADCQAAVGAVPALLLTDIDHFKRVNDSFGHLFGDQVLRAVAQGMRACLEAGQFVARVGGEEFAVLLPACRPAQAQGLAERIRAAVAGSRIRRRDGGELGQVTVSLGVASRRPGEPPEAWFDRADKALYAAKHAGRNRVVMAD
jgi:diguanylate cyclase